MKISKAELWHIRLPMKFTFRTSQGEVAGRDTLVIGVTDETGRVGYGEAVPFVDPFYTAETLADSYRFLATAYLPLLPGRHLIGNPNSVEAPLALHEQVISDVSLAMKLPVQAVYPMALAGVENALLNLWCSAHGKNTVATILGESLGTRIHGGVVLGDMPIPDVLRATEKYVQAGYRRVKLKISPRDGYERLAAVRRAFPELMLAADANRSYPVSEAAQVARLQELQLRSLEEPFQVPVGVDAATVYQALQANGFACDALPLCFDESVQSLEALKTLATTGAVTALTIKIGRLGGLRQAVQCIQFCRQNGIGFWIGSMVESSISKLLHVQLASVADAWMPGDLSDSSRYFAADLTEPALAFTDGYMTVPQGPGLGATVQLDRILQSTVQQVVFTA